jgi:hypothetical protein
MIWRVTAMTLPQVGDVLIRSLLEDGYDLVDAMTLRRINGRCPQLLDALEAARSHGGAGWQQVTDMQGRPLTDPVRLPDL